MNVVVLTTSFFIACSFSHQHSWFFFFVFGSQFLGEPSFSYTRHFTHNILSLSLSFFLRMPFFLSNTKYNSLFPTDPLFNNISPWIILLNELVTKNFIQIKHNRLVVIISFFRTSHIYIRTGALPFSLQIIMIIFLRTGKCQRKQHLTH